MDLSIQHIDDLSLAEAYNLINNQCSHTCSRNPVSNYDVMNLLKSLNEEGSTIVMVTHSRKDAAYANRIINLFDGKIVDEDNNEF